MRGRLLRRKQAVPGAMAAETQAELKLEIAHVLTMDVVEYSTLFITEQRDLMAELNRIVRNTARFRKAEADGKLVRLPTGDGMALVFLDDPEAPLECAMEISAATKDHPQLRLRMGIHSGPVSETIDVNDQRNLAGAALDIAQRVVECGDAGHILLSKHVADDLAPYRRWHDHLHDLGEYEVKHGRRIPLVNFYTNELGNPELPNRGRGALAPTRATWMRADGTRKVALASAGVLVLVALLVLAYAITRRGASATPVDKSVAVLPFENLSDDKADAFFAEGVQDDILTAVSKIADLKVISRTSVTSYRPDAKRDLREIGNALRVAHVLEGSVRRVEKKVRVTAQLIEVRTGVQLWGERYDAELADIFAIQTQIAQSIAEQLHAALSPKERAQLKAAPTNNLEAYDLYLRAKAVSRHAIDGRREIIEERLKLLNEAVARDPSFVPALCQLARAHLAAYWHYHDHTPARLALARDAIDRAAHLRRDVGEVHLARARLHYWGERDYPAALAELERARRELPNEPEVVYFTSLIERRMGDWENSLRHLEEARRIDPRNVNVSDNLAKSYIELRRYTEAARVLEDVLTWRPSDFNIRLTRAWIDAFAQADLRRLETLLADESAQFTDADALANARIQLALARRDHVAAGEALAACKKTELQTELSDLAYVVPREFFAGLIARARGDRSQADAAFLSARERASAMVARRPDDARGFMVVAEIDARLGRREEAIGGAERAHELLPPAKDALYGPILMRRLAGVYAQTGETNRALEMLERAASLPNGAHYGMLKLDEVWDPIRHEARFETVVASLLARDSR